MTYDLIVLGGGPAGYLASERAGHAGMSVLLIEERSVGGVCLNEGCIPTKTLLYSAKVFESAKYGKKYGVMTSDIAIDHADVIKRKDKVVKTLVAGVKAALKANGVTLVGGRGIITGKSAEGYTVDVGGDVYTGRRLLITTGSQPSLPPIPGLADGIKSNYVMTSREALEQSEVMRKLVVIGGGVIGLELAAYYNTVGAEVTVIEALDHIAGDSDKDLVKLLQRGYEKKGIKFLLSTKVTEITESGVKYENSGGIGSIQCDKILLSVGRKANTSNIGLETIHVLTKRGAIVTDERMKTNQPSVYAAGDVNGKSMLAHTAYRETEVAVNNMLGIRDKMSYAAIPSVLYTNPELASVGETEYTANEKGLTISTVSVPMRFSGRYLAENEGGDGICKLVIDKRKNTILGAQALCNYSSEFIVAVAAFIERGMMVDDIKRVVFPHPTVAEIIREAVFQI